MTTGTKPSSPHTSENRSFNIVSWAIEHNYAVFALYLAVAIAAIIAIGFFFPTRMMPYVQSPMIGIITMQEGLPGEDMETYISKPIEEAMVDIKGVRYIRSTSQDGFSMVSLEFPYGYNIDRAYADVQARMLAVQGQLPSFGANLKPSWVLPIDPLNLPVLTMNLTGQGWDPVRLRQLADNQITDQLKMVPEVWSVYTFGGYKRQLQVLVDRTKLAAYGISILDVSAAIDRQNVSEPAGRLTTPQSEAIARLNTLAQNASDLMSYTLKAVGDRVVYIRDVARVTDTYQEKRSAYHHVHDGAIDTGIEVSIIQEPQASSPNVIKRLMEQVAALEKQYPGIKFTVSYNNAHFVGILMRNMLEELIVAVLLTGLAVVFFLNNWRGTLISVMTIPLALSMAVLALLPMGMTLNSSTLIGLLLSIGRLVDDSIIDIHAIERHLRMGKDVHSATVDGITEVRLAVAASTMVLILALVPLLLCGGIVQEMFVGLVWPIIFGLIFSFAISLTLTPVLAVRLLQPVSHRQQRSNWFSRNLLVPFDSWMTNLEERYRLTVLWMLDHRFLNMARILATIIIGITFYNFIGSEMMPLADVGQAYGVFEMDPSSSFEATEKAVTDVEKIMLKYPEIKSVSTEIGWDPGGTYYNGYSMQAANTATFMITLSDKDERSRTIWAVIDAVQKEATDTIPGIRRFQIKEMGSDVMASSQAPVTVLITGPDLPILSTIGRQTADIASQTKGAYQVGTDWAMGKPEWRINVDPRRAAEIGLTPEQVAQQAYYSLTGGLTNQFYRLPNLRQRTILVRYDEPERQTPQDLLLTSITGANGEQVPLNTLATISYQSGPTLINHDQLRRAVSVLASYRKGGLPSMDLAMSIMDKAMSTLNWPPGYTIEMRGDMTQMMDSFSRLLNGLGFALLLIFLLLVAQFRGFLQPLQMIFSIPLELAGVFTALWLAHQAFSTVSIMAVIILTGMDVTTAILLIDQILRVRAEGVPRNEAIAAACSARLRPILMTSVITIIVMLPVALFPKTGMDAYSPLGTVIVGGLLVGTVLSLFDIPIMHSYIDDLSTGIRRRLKKKP